MSPTKPPPFPTTFPTAADSTYSIQQPRDRARSAQTDLDRAASIERGDEPTGQHSISPELHELAAMRRRFSEMETERATDIRLIHEMREQLAKRISYPPTADKNGGTLKAIVMSVLLVISSTVGTIVWFENRAKTISEIVVREEYDSSARRNERAEELDLALSTKIALSTSEMARRQQEALQAITERLIRIEVKLDPPGRRTR